MKLNTAPSVSTAQPGQAVAINGVGFDTNAVIDVYLDTTDVALSISNGRGVATASVTVPTTASPCTHWITLVERASNRGAQAPVTVNTDWLQTGFAVTGHNLNPFENTLNFSNVPELDAAWIVQDGFYGNPAPLLEMNGVLFNGNVEGTVNAYSNTGSVLWTATIANGFMFSPVIADGLVIFDNANNVSAYKVKCASNGATCTPSWSVTPPVALSGGLSYYKGTVYVGGSDGNVYPINPLTGAFGTPFYALSNSAGAINTVVSFGADGTYSYGTLGGSEYGATFQFLHPNQSSYLVTTSGFGFSNGAILGADIYYQDSTGTLQKNFAEWQVTLPGSSNCLANPAVAYGYVYAGSCSSIGAYSTLNGDLVWSVTTGSNVTGITVANGVVYACIGSAIVAYEANYGGVLWTGGSCSQAPIVVNGTLYTFGQVVGAYTVNGTNPLVSTRKPQRSLLKPNLSLAAQRTPEAP